MARKLTGQERIDAEALRDALVEALPPSERGYAPGIASALVRLPGPQVSTADVARILTKYQVDQAAMQSMVKAGVLLPADGEDGLFELNVPSTESDGAASGESAAVESAAAEPVAGDAVTNDGPAHAAQPAHETEKSDAAGEPSGDASSSGEASGKAAAGEKDSSSESGGAASAAESEGDAPAGDTFAQEGDPADQGERDAAPGQPKREGARTRRRSRSGHGRRQQGQSKSQDKTEPAQDLEAVQQPDAPVPGQVAPSKPAAAPQHVSKPAAASQPKPASRHDPKRDLKKVPYVRRGSEADAEVRKKIVSLDQRFWMNGWLLSHPGAYTLYERELTAINDVLTDGMLPGDITRRQLAYQMGGDEKFFEYGSDGFKLLRAMGMEDVIRHRPTPKPDLVYHAPRRRKHMRVLVTENLDPYLDVHDLMYEDGRTQILGERIHAVVLGGGTPVLEHNRLALLLDTLGADTVEVLYWGDIDRAGVDLMMKLKDVLGEKYRFSPFAPAYQLMVERAMERFPDPEDNESTGQCNIDVPDTSLLCAGLTDEAAAYARAVIDACGLIPQEILTKRDL